MVPSVNTKSRDDACLRSFLHVQPLSESFARARCRKGNGAGGEVKVRDDLFSIVPSRLKQGGSLCSNTRDGDQPTVERSKQYKGPGSA
ncbi:hypothetical protein IG631_20386 [Alternaria alternata]|nr:hypothetical protein IG631_20386 [Alternaria alternata]